MENNQVEVPVTIHTEKVIGNPGYRGYVIYGKGPKINWELTLKISFEELDRMGVYPGDAEKFLRENFVLSLTLDDGLPLFPDEPIAINIFFDVIENAYAVYRDPRYRDIKQSGAERLLQHGPLSQKVAAKYMLTRSATLETSADKIALLEKLIGHPVL